VLRWIAFAVALGVAPHALAQDAFKDPQDGAFDASDVRLVDFDPAA
jgi:hypothetical protein